MSDDVWSILIIDDSPDDRKEVRRLLLNGSDRRYRFAEAETGAAGVRTVLDSASSLPNCVVLDYHLPDMDGLEVLAALTGPEEATVCPVVMLTGTTDLGLGRTVLRAGSQDFLGKSWMTAESLSRAVENAAERWAMARDLRASEAAVRAGEQQLQLALSAARAGVWAWDVKTGAITWSPENFSLYGYDLTGEPPAYADWEERVHPDDRGRTIAAVRNALDSRAEEFQSEFRVVHPTQGIRWLLGLGKVNFDPAGIPMGMVGINLDITERKHMQDALQEADRRKDEFLATLAHELRNPLAPIRTGLQLLRISPGGPAAADVQDVMERQLGHIVRLVDDLMDLSRINSGKVELKQERLQLRVVLDHAIEASRPLIEAGGHTLAITVADEPVWLHGDLTRLTQVVSNLLNNSAKYTANAGHIGLSASVQGNQAVIVVTDNGSGISADMLSKVFDMFTQVDRTLDRAQGGLGIGLSLVRKLLAMHGGTITAESPGLGLGSTFTVRLPLTAREELQESIGADANVTVAAQSTGRRVLIVDDNVDAAETLSMMLKLFGHNCRAVHNGSAALAVAREFLPEIVFLDIGLPGMNGYEVAQQFRADSAISGAVLVALTGWGSENDKRKSHEAGFDHHLTKPAEAREVHGLIAQVGVAPR